MSAAGKGWPPCAPVWAADNDGDVLACVLAPFARGTSLRVAHACRTVFRHGPHSCLYVISLIFEGHHAMTVNESFASCCHLAERQTALAEARVQEASAQRYAEQDVAVGILHHPLAFALWCGLLHQLHAFAHAVARF